jgi:hypothetical protein
MSQKIPMPAKAELILQYDTHISMNALASHFNTSRATAKKWLKHYGIPLKTHKDTCAAKNKTLDRTFDSYIVAARKKLEEPGWLYEQRVTLRRSKTSIAQELNCSHIMVNSYLKKMGVPQIRLNESEASTKSRLNDKALLESLYSQDKTMEQIAEAVGSSKATVSLAFAKLGIDVRESNYYERKFQRVSAGHAEINNFISETCGITPLVNNRTLIGTEIDILIPEKQFGIEFNGLFYHHERVTEEKPALRKGRDYHLAKTVAAEKAGYHLFHIFSDQWNEQKPIVQSMIRNKLGMSTRLYARKLKVEAVDRDTRRQFMAVNHIQGRDNALFALGLFKHGELISCMSFGIPRYWKNQNCFELIRFCNKLDHTVVGGFSRLLSAYLNEHNSDLVSYADRTYSKGSVYRQHGFELERTNPPSYYYVDKTFSCRYPRTMFTKQHIQTRFGVTNTDYSEKELMQRLGFRRVWDCGTMTFVLRR